MTENKRATRNGDVNNHIAEHYLQTKHQTLRDVSRILQTTINDSL